MSDDDFFVPPGHFYSPIVDPEEALRHMSRSDELKAPMGVILDIEKMDKFWVEAEPRMVAGQAFIQNNESARFKFDNDFFGYGDALIYREMLYRYKPKNVIEIGSGYSSALLLDVIDEFDLSVKCSFIEPFPAILKSIVDPAIEKKVTLIESKVQDVDLTLFESLEPNDILFVDSSHVVKTGSDVLFEIFEILPRLAKGVIIHFHDVFHNFEYPQQWAVDQNRSWNEIYFLRLLLSAPSEYNVIFFNSFYANVRPGMINKSDAKFKLNPGGSLWFTKN